MSFTVTVTTTNEAALLKISGQLTLGEGGRQLRDKVVELLGLGTKNIVLLMSEVSYIDSTGLAQLVDIYSRVTRGGGRLLLLQPSKRIVDQLQITKLISIFEIFHDAAAAYAALSRNNEPDGKRD